MTLTIGVDIGGTKIAAGVVNEEGEIIARLKEPTTPGNPKEISDAVAKLVLALCQDHDVVAVGIGAAGFVNAGRSTVLFAPNIDWVDEPLAELVGKQVDLPVIVENDANAAAWGEFRFGAARDDDDLLLVTVGTGIGGGIIQDGVLLRGGFGVAAEIGHLRIVRDGILCGCGQHGCWEQYGSGSALVRMARERVHSGAVDASALMAAAGGDLAAIKGPLITSLAQSGDALCRDLLTELGRWLGEGVAALAAVLDPSVVAFGGGVPESGDLLMKSVNEAFLMHLSAAEHRPHAQLRIATLGNEAGLIGAADLARPRVS
ncbi:ROK family glucokinase [soil metagenome]